MFKPLIELYIPIFILVDVHVKQLILTPIISKKKWKRLLFAKIILLVYKDSSS